ncbi:MAG: SMC-Scp complex subunit ScpB [bacterium]
MTDTLTSPIAEPILEESASLEPQEIAEEEIEADPAMVEAQLLADDQLLQRALLGILFLEPDPLSPARIAQGLGIATEAAAAALETLRTRLSDEGLTILAGAGQYSLGTHPDIAPILERYFKRARRRRLSRAMLETLSVIACKGPVTRAEIEEMRQVNCDGVLARCLDLEFVEVTGQKATPGRPLQYSVTARFLQYFELQTVDELQARLPLEWTAGPKQTYLDLNSTATGELPQPALEDVSDQDDQETTE